MSLEKLEKRKYNLTKIREVIEISKFETLQKLQNTQKVNKSFFEITREAKKTLQMLQSRYKFRNKVVDSLKKEAKTLWIYITAEPSILKTVYRKQEEVVKQYSKPEDEFIAVGKLAIDFCNKYNKKVIFSEENEDLAIGSVPEIITSLYLSGNLKLLKIVSNSSLFKSEPLIILPIEESNLVGIDQLDDGSEDIYTFYPSIPKVVENLVKIYISKVVEALLRESKSFYLREKLIKHESSIKSINEKLDSVQREINKTNRKKDTEELIQTFQLSRRGRE